MCLSGRCTFASNTNCGSIMSAVSTNGNAIAINAFSMGPEWIDSIIK